MLLYVNGCSMTFGEELGPRGDPICNTRAWPRYLGEMMNVPVRNDARPAGSNDRIVRTTVNFIAHYLTEHPAEDLRVVIGWTKAMRREFHDVENDRWYDFIPSDPQSAGPLTPVYCPDFCSTVEATGRYFVQLLTMQSFLIQHKIAYVFFAALRGERDPVLQRLIDTSRFFRGDDTFMAWAVRHEYPFGPNQHPLEDGHRAWAALMYQEMWSPE
jgi:Family of unknown function (DUF6071)